MGQNRRPANSLYVVSGNPDTVNISPTDFTSLGYRQGELGQIYESKGRQYQLVQLDSGVTSATTGGVVAANDLAFWKDRATYRVTKDPNQVIGGLTGFYNEVAGVFRNAVTPNLIDVLGIGQVCFILQAGKDIPVKTTGSPAIGDHCRANQSTPVADAANTLGTTACPTQRLGTFTSTVSGGNANVDLDIPGIT